MQSTNSKFGSPYLATRHYKHVWFLERASLQTNLNQQYHSRYDMSVWEWSARGIRAEESPSTAWEWVLPEIHINALLIKAKWWVGSWEEICRTVKDQGSQAGIQNSPLVRTDTHLWDAIISQKAWQNRVWNIPRSCCKGAHCYARFFPFLCVRWT